MEGVDKCGTGFSEYLITYLDSIPAFKGGFVDADDANFDDFGLGEAEGEEDCRTKQEADDEGFWVDLF